MLTAAWTPLRYHAQQSRLWRTKRRFVAVAAGRGSGKTELARRRAIRFLPIKKPWPDPMYFYALPTRSQCKRVAWQSLLALIPAPWIKKINESEMMVKTIFGSRLFAVGMDRPQRIEGNQWDGGVIDESCDQHPGSFDKSILPALSHRDGWCWRIGVPKRVGVGAADFKGFFFDKCEERYSWPSSDILSEAKLRYAMENLDPRDYREQYHASWETAGGLVFHAFDAANIQDAACYHADKSLIVSSDFNVNPMCWVLGHLTDDGLDVFDELFVRNTNTPNTLDMLFARHGGHRSGFEFYGDASGRARKTSASASDYAIIRQDNRFSGAAVYYAKKNPRVTDRVASCNALLCNAAGQRRLRIHPRCKVLIKDLQERAWKEDRNEPDDYGDVGHMSDALGYVVHRRYPITVIKPENAPDVGF